MKLRALGMIFVVLCLLMPLVACTNSSGTEASSSGTEASQEGGEADGADTAPVAGSIIESAPMTDVDPSVGVLKGRSFRVTYWSTSGITGKPTQVTGAVFVPPGKAPHLGWPVLAFAHGTIGINPECSPSRTPDLLKSISLVSTYLQLGYAIAAPDYEGLGGPGAHPYLDAKTAGFNLIDSVRALRAVAPDVGKRWGALGGSQGGAVTWAANEQAATYAPELSLIGAVALAPLADNTGFVDKALAHTLTKDQEGVYIWLLMGLERTRQGFNIDDYRHGNAATNWTALSQCTDAAQDERNRALFTLGVNDLVPANAEAERRLRGILQKMALPQQKIAAPMLVMFGGRDTYVDPEWVQGAIARACALGGRIAVVFQADRGHTDLDPAQFSGWLMARFEGMPAPTSCPQT